MPVQIAIPAPTGSDAAYNARSLPQYVAAVEAAGAEAVVVRLNEAQERLTKLLAGVLGILLPGSGFDVDPEQYGVPRIAECGPPDPARAAVDELLLQDAFNHRKPILAICYGAQSLNVWRKGSLIQDLDTVMGTPVNHRPGREVVEAHSVRIRNGSRLSRLLPPGKAMEVQVNSSHHQAILEAGDSLVVSAVSPLDGVIEAVELDDADHFVVGVQWHPERTFEQSSVSRAIFSAFVDAVAAWIVPPMKESAFRI